MIFINDKYDAIYYFQEFEDYRDADDAIYELNGKDLCGERYKDAQFMNC